MHIKSRSETKLVHLKKTTNFYCQKFIFFSVLMETKELNPHQICIYLANLKIAISFLWCSMNIAYMMVIIATTDYVHQVRNCNATVNGSQTIKYCNKRFTENKTQSEWEQIHYIKGCFNINGMQTNNNRVLNSSQTEYNLYVVQDYRYIQHTGLVYVR